MREGYTEVIMLTTEDIQKLSETLVTKEDINGVRKEAQSFQDEVKAEFKNVREEAQGFRAEVKAEFKSVRSEIQTEFKDVREDMTRFATHQDIVEVKSDLDGLRESIQAILTATDRLAKPIEDLKLEYAAISTHLSRHEKWIKELATKVGVQLSEV